ncbi:hypothetical protein EB796_019842 [Bugula neritina]|uniref:Uncharacterized protein n=1 Tax=Bugula neritina TaxID=10212 RepID=A0A7J7J6I7_BUGNE|nr:hypothetical protein EB796_019842 [Bugula neritina]
MRLAIYGSDAKNFDIAVSYNNIGFVYNTQGRYIEALEYYSKFIDIALAVYGQDALHQDVAVGYSNIELFKHEASCLRH